jgi:Leucine-rich repeat (LRR) protein
MAFLPEERDFFIQLAAQADLSLEQLELTMSFSPQRPWVTFDERGHVVRLDLRDFSPTGLPSKRALVVDGAPLRELRELRLFNQDVEISLTSNHALEVASIEFCRQRALALPAGIEELRIAGNPLEAFEAARFPKLRKLGCANTPIERLDVSALTELETLECGWNDNAYYREPSSGPRLRELVLGRLPHLRELLAHNWLYPKTPKGTRIGAIDVTGLPALEVLNVAHCDLEKLDVRQNPKLRTLVASNNPLTSLHLPPPDGLALLHVDECALSSLDLSGRKALTSLACGGRTLRTLGLSGCSALAQLRCADATLSTLDLSDAVALEGLVLARVPLTQLDLRASKRLRDLVLVDCKAVKTIACHEMQKQVVPGLRTFFKLAKPTKDPKAMDPFTLHAWADRYNWDDGAKKLLTAIRNPSCSLATALLVYWRAQPYWYLQYADDREARADPTGKTIVPLIREIEQRVADGVYRHHPLIPWSPGKTLVDPYPQHEKKRSLPRVMLEISEVEHHATEE